ncbi:MAG: SpoIID/LytB domain-containing protein, partial [Planctomycetota bacterium]|nr:SpoIID/LytB domain-containing protein [Planctomycetota bacterium]
MIHRVRHVADRQDRRLRRVALPHTYAALLWFGLLLLSHARAVPRAADADTPKTPETAQEPIVRVVLIESTGSFKLDLRGPYTLHELGKQNLLARGETISKMEVIPDPAGIRFGTTAVPKTRVTLTPLKNDLLEVDGKKYCGALDVIKGNDGKLMVVNRVSMETYLESVVAAEIGPDAPAAALQAQAVAARTYASSRIDDERQTRAHMYFDLFPDTRSQVYKGHTVCGTNVPRAVTATRGMVLTFKGRLITAYFHSTCGGRTESVKNVFSPNEIPPLAGIVCGWCDKTQYSSWKFKLSGKALAEKLAQKKHPVGEIRNLETDNVTPAGRVGQVKIWHSKKETALRV